jgi:hypothetical protein
VEARFIGQASQIVVACRLYRTIDRSSDQSIE